MKLERRSLAAVTAAVVLVVGSAGISVPRAAAAQEDEAEGRRRFKRGEELYVQGKFLDAAREFEAGYAAAPRFPRFLLNIGHAYRRAGELVRAKEAYQKLLRLQPDFQKRSEIEEYIRSIDDALLAGETVPEPSRGAPATPVGPPPAPSPSMALDPVLTPPAPSPPPANLSAAPPPASVMETASSPADESPSRSIFARPWFWIVAGAVVAGSVAAVVIATRPSACQATLCIKE